MAAARRGRTRRRRGGGAGRGRGGRAGSGATTPTGRATVITIDRATLITSNERGRLNVAGGIGTATGQHVNCPTLMTADEYRVRIADKAGGAIGRVNRAA